MIEAVFISDLHLDQENKEIQERFSHFLEWAKYSVKSIYILGDFFHSWAGDDAIDEWSFNIAKQLSALKEQGIRLFYMHGNRDFLLGKTFAKLADWTVLNDPCVINLSDEKVLLSHGDRYCTQDFSHQRFRLLTRNSIFSNLFLSLPLKLRKRLVNQVRYRSQMKQKNTIGKVDVVESSVVEQMLKYNVTQLIHGHTHLSKCISYNKYVIELKRYVLSDWDDKPSFLCYDRTKEFYFIQL